MVLDLCPPYRYVGVAIRQGPDAMQMVRHRIVTQNGATTKGDQREEICPARPDAAKMGHAAERMRGRG